VVMPATPFDAKGLFIAALEDPNPVLYIDDRWLYSVTGAVPEDVYRVPIGEASIRRVGFDVTIVAISWMAAESWKAAEILAKEGIDAEVIDLRSLKPWDRRMVVESARKTGRVVIADPGWRTAGASAEIAAVVNQDAFDCLQAPVERVTLPDTPAPGSRVEERAYYPAAADVCAAAKRTLARERGLSGGARKRNAKQQGAAA